MKRRKLVIFGISLLVFGTGIGAIADVNVLNLKQANFQDGQVLSANTLNTLLNDNFAFLETAMTGLETSKQNRIGNPCPSGQFVRGVGADGKLECAVDQVGSGGSAGVSSLNGKSGSLTIQAGDNVTVNTGDDGKITVSAAGGGGGLTLPFSAQADGGDAAFAITNTSATALSGSTENGNGVYGFSGAAGNGVSGYSETGPGVVGFSNTGVSGVYGESKINGGAGVRGVNSVGPGSSGVWGESASGSGVRGSSETGAGVQGSSTTGYGVRGIVSQTGTGVYGENTANAAGAGVQGRADHANAVGVMGTSTSGKGVHGVTSSGYGVYGLSMGSGYAGYFEGDVNIERDLYVSGKQIMAGELNVVQDGNFGGDVYARGIKLTSDENAKEDFASVDGRELLDKLASLSIQTWRYKGAPDTVRHLGPTAQAFKAAFDLGDDDTHIAAVDAQGVALVAIQALFEMVQEKDAQLAALAQQNAVLEGRLAALERVAESR